MKAQTTMLNVSETVPIEEREEIFCFRCPDKYKDRLFLTPKDMQEILGIKESLTYSFLTNAPFRTEKVGSRILVFANSFWDWYNCGSFHVKIRA